MDFIKNNWIILLILIVLAYLVYKYWEKTKLSKVNTGNYNTATNFVNSVKSDTGSVIIKPEVDVVKPVINDIASSWKIGDKIYAKEKGANTYSSTSTSISYLVQNYNNNQYIGDYLGMEKGYVKLAVTTKSNSLLSAFGYEDNAIRYTLSQNVYTK